MRPFLPKVLDSLSIFAMTLGHAAAKFIPGKRTNRSLLATPAFLFLLSSLSATAVRADFYKENFEPFIKEHCVRCHGPEKQESDLRLDTLETDFSHRRTADVWIEVMDNLNLEEMPPIDEPQPPVEQTAAVAGWIAESLREAESAHHAAEGRVVMRRLNRTEYANTIRDLFGLEFLDGEGPLALLPPDGKVQGFDKVTTGLLLDPSLLESYYDVGASIASQAVVTDPPEYPTHRLRWDYENEDVEADPKIDPAPDGIFIYNTYKELVSPDFYGRDLPRFKLQYPNANLQMVPEKGRYRIRIRAAADPGDRGEPLFLTYFSKKDGAFFRQKIDAPLDAPKTYEAIVTLNPQRCQEIRLQMSFTPWFTTVDQRLRALQSAAKSGLEDGQIAQSYHFQARQLAEGHYQGWRMTDALLHKDTAPKVYVDFVEFEGPLHPNWPSKFLTRWFPNGFDPQKTSREEIEAAIAGLLPKAYRRPVTDAEVAEIMRVVDAELNAGENSALALQAGITNILCSPHFLFLAEPGETEQSLDDIQLASRLSYFLWSSMPDPELIELAEAGQLHDPDTIRQQVDRMIADDKAEGFIRGFASQWLKVEDFNRFSPDKEIYRKYYQEQFKGIISDFEEEPLAFVRTLLRNDESLLDLIDSDWTMANARLAAYYGIPNVEGEEFQRVSLPADSPRGGLLGMAGVHQWGSDGNRTKPVERAKYVRDVIFNDPPNPPPPNVGEVEPNIEGENLTIRERLKQHQQIESCAACHKRLDPYGLALENFNVIGEWREVADGEGIDWGGDPPPLDVSGTLPNGASFASFKEYKQALLHQEERFLRGLSEKLILYALGRTATASDRPLIDHLVASARADDYKLRTILTELAISETFRSK